MVRWVAESEAPCPNADAMIYRERLCAGNGVSTSVQCEQVLELFFEDLEKRSRLGV